MISQSIKTIDELLLFLTSNSDGYYIEQNAIASKININGHITYSRFKYFSGKITKVLLEQHKSKYINMAVALKDYSALVLEYSGVFQEAFVSLVAHFIGKEYSDKILIIKRNNLNITLYIKLKSNNLKDFLKVKQKVTKNLEYRLTNEWKILPSNLNPEIGNILQLPREFLEVNYK